MPSPMILPQNVITPKVSGLGLWLFNPQTNAAAEAVGSTIIHRPPRTNPETMSDVVKALESQNAARLGLAPVNGNWNG